MLGNTRFERSWGGQFRGSCARLSVPAGHRNGERRWGRIWGLGGNAYGERRARLREPATSVASKKATITRHRRLFRVQRAWGIET